MIRNVLFVCIGNICRSPMAEALFAHALPDRVVCSAGLQALVGHGADQCAIELMQERGIDISEHRAQQLASWMVHESDLIVTMDRDQQRYIESTYHAARGKVRPLLEGAWSGVPDPYRQGRRAFRHSLELIEVGTAQLVSRIAETDAATIIAPPVSSTRLRAAGTLPP